MRDVAFLISNQYQIHHFAPIATLVDDVTFVIERRSHDFGVTPSFIRDHVPGVRVEDIEHKYLHLLDGRFRIIVCHTPVLPHRLLKKSMIVAQQYSMAKESYQYGAWRSLATLNLMYGPYSFDRVRGFSDAVMVGNPSMDRYFDGTIERPAAGPTNRRSTLSVLYLPTYGPHSSVDATLPRLGATDAQVTVKLHHAHVDPIAHLPGNCTLVGPDTPPAELLRQHDCVISDYSGAAYDALHARRPLIRVGDDAHPPSSVAPSADGDRDRDVLAPLSTTWSDGALDDAYRRAAALIDDDRVHAGFVARRYVCDGIAAPAAAAAIVDLLDNGPPQSFAVRQVRTRLTDLIAEKNALAEEVRMLRKRNGRLSGSDRSLWQRASWAIRMRAVTALHRFPRLQRVVVTSKQALTNTITGRRSGNA